MDTRATPATSYLEDAAARLGRPTLFDVVPVADFRSSLSPCIAADVDLRQPKVVCGKVSAAAGEAAYQAIHAAVQMASSGDVDAICTAPINKEALNLAGYHYGGHTELLAALTGVRNSVMMLAHGALRVSHVSTHVALSDVPGGFRSPACDMS